MEHYVIPYDFGSTGQVALNYAEKLADINKAKISLLYVANNNSDRSRAETEFKKLNYSYRVVVGNLLEVISVEAQKMNGSIILMAIKNESSFQKLFGSTAIKVITESSIPFLIIQENNHLDVEINKIALTIDTKEESLQVLNTTISFCETHNAELVIISGKQSDKILQNKLSQSIKEMTRSLNTTNIKFSTVELDKKNFLDNLFEYCQKENVDFLAVTYYKDSSTFISSNFVQRLLENKLGIPVLTIGGKEISAYQKIFNNMVCPISIDKIDSNISRMTIFINVILMVIFLITYAPVYAYIVTLDYFIRAFISAKYSPIRLVAMELVKVMNLKPKRINLAPKIFASRLGFLCAAVGVLFFHLDIYLGSIISIGMLAILSFMDSVLNFCVGCLIYNYFVYPIFKYKNR